MLVNRTYTLGLVTRSLPFLVIFSRPATDVSGFTNLQMRVS